MFVSVSHYANSVSSMAPIHLQCNQHHLVPKASSIALLHLFSQDNQNEFQHWHCCWHHMMLMVSKMAALHSSHQNNWNSVKHDFSLQCDATDINTGIMWCHWHWCLYQVIPMYWYQHHMMWTSPPMVPLYSLGQDDQNKVQHVSLVMKNHWD